MLNEMLDRPVINKDVLKFLRKKSNTLPKYLENMIEDANKRRVPIIQRETIDFFIFLLGILKPKKILEVGTGIGFSALLFLEILKKDVEIKTVDRFDIMFNEAKNNFKRYDKEKKIELIFEDGVLALKKVKGKFDFVFLDCAKSSYVKLVPLALKKLKKNGIIVIDDIFQGSDTLKDVKEISRNNRIIYKRLNELIDTYKDNKKFITTFLPLGDGLMLLRLK